MFKRIVPIIFLLALLCGSAAASCVSNYTQVCEGYTVCFGATSTWFQALLKHFASNASGFDAAALATAVTALFAEHGALVLGLIALVFVVPTAVYVALARD